jgi:predicted SnoaL-like aldol condensation-catalyzing enzyme
MSTEQKKALLSRLIKEVFNRGNFSLVDELLAPGFVDHEEPPPGIPPGREGVKQLTNMFRSAFPDFKTTIDDMIA